jgi:serine/threonine protein kinase
MPSPRTTETVDLARLAGLKLGNYRLERLIGRGRMGVVYLANDEALLRPTAIKILSWKAADAQGQDPVKWFLGEARMVARINHPRVVQIYGAARQGDHCYIAMEYVVGRSAEAIVGEGPLSAELATDILLQAAAALHAAHGSGIVHRDVKPANLLVGQDGVTKLGDFGMALGSADLAVGNAHIRVGTPYYTAPEIWTGAKASAASDIYSLGATYYHLLTGRPPFPGPSVSDVEQAHLRAPIPDPRAYVPSLPPSCAALIARALAKDPGDRFESALVLLWEGRRVMQDVVAATGGSAGASERFEHAFSPLPTAGPRRLPPPAPENLRVALGFLHRPFCDVAPHEAAIAAPPAQPNSDELQAYLSSWIRATLTPGAPRIVISRDALLLLALRSDGVLERINCIAENMLHLAASERRRTLCSWHAWAASDQERWSERRPATGLPRRPEVWPPPEVADVIDVCRRGAGLPPWPRGAGRSG